MTEIFDGNYKREELANFHDPDSLLHAAAERRAEEALASKKVEDILDRFEDRGKEN